MEEFATQVQILCAFILADITSESRATAMFIFPDVRYQQYVTCSVVQV